MLGSQITMGKVESLVRRTAEILYEAEMTPSAWASALFLVDESRFCAVSHCFYWDGSVFRVIGESTRRVVAVFQIVRRPSRLDGGFRMCSQR